MKKKFLTGLLSVSMAAAMLTGCGGSKAPAEDKAQTEEADDTEEAAEAEEAGEEEAGDDGEEASADEAQAAIDERKAEAEKNGEYEKIIIGFFDWTGTPAGIDRINEALSAHTEETLGLDVELQIIDSAAYGDDMKLMLSSGEQMDMQNIQYLSQNSAHIQDASVGLASIPSVSVRMAMATVGVLPILVIYPFVQGNFVKGITLGGVKG